MEWEVDVICIPLGFPKKSPSISHAIRGVEYSQWGAIIFLASAGNNVNRAEGYPGWDSPVISIYATESTGAFLGTNSIPWEKAQPLLGTYGDKVPDAILADLRAQSPQGDFSAGTSVATAVAAGIVGLMLAYAALIPHVLPGCGAEDLYSELKKIYGMRHLLSGMVKPVASSQYFINPIQFCSQGSDDSKMYHAMCRAVSSKDEIT